MLKVAVLVTAALAVASADPAPRVEITGAHAFGEAELRSAAFGSDEPAVFDGSGAIIENAVDQAELRLTDYYYDRGYPNARVGPPVVTPFHVAVPVDEGDRYTIGSVAFTGTLVGDPAAHLVRMQTRAGMVFDRDAIVGDNDALVARYQDLGYAWAHVVPLTKIDFEHHTIALAFEIAPGRTYYVDHIAITNTTKIPDATLLDAAKPMRGHELYSASALAEYKRTLLALGAPAVAITTEPGTTPDTVVVKVEVGN